MSLTVSRVKECFELIHSFIYSTLGMVRRGASTIYHAEFSVVMDIAVNKRDKTPDPLGAYVKLELRTKILYINSSMQQLLNTLGTEIKT